MSLETENSANRPTTKFGKGEGAKTKSAKPPPPPLQNGTISRLRLPDFQPHRVLLRCIILAPNAHKKLEFSPKKVAMPEPVRRRRRPNVYDGIAVSILPLTSVTTDHALFVRNGRSNAIERNLAVIAYAIRKTTVFINSTRRFRHPVSFLKIKRMKTT